MSGSTSPFVLAPSGDVVSLSAMRPISSVSVIPPGPGGVYDYALKLATPLNAPIVELSRTTDTSEWAGEMLLVHYSGYGYQKRGAPTWLNEKLREVRGRYRVFGVVFHELYASGPPWRSAFWLSSSQRRIVEKLANEADFWFTNREVASEWLKKHSPAVPHADMPVFSNVGEPSLQDLNDFEKNRARTIVVFGSNSMRKLVYAWNNGEIFDIAKRQGLAIHDIGPHTDNADLAQRLKRESVIVHGRLSAEQVSAALLQSEFGALVYIPTEAAKSGIFAAYAAHGVCPVMLCKDGSERDGLKNGFNYLSGLNELLTEKSRLNSRLVGQNARMWYEPHALEAQVAMLKKLKMEALS